MSARLAVSWLEATFLAGVDDGDDARDWLDGRDDAIHQRRNDRAEEAIVLAGGKVRR